MVLPVAWCFGTAVPATVLLHGAHHALTVGGAAGVAWLLAPASWGEHARRVVGGAPRTAAATWACVAVVGSLTAGLVHLLVVPGHLGVEAGPWLAPGFAVVGLLQLGWAHAVARAPAGVALLAGGAALHGGALAVWLTSRTVGLPAAVVPAGGVTVVGLPDLAAATCQVLALLAVVVLARRASAHRRAGTSGSAGGGLAAAAADVRAWSAWPAGPRLLAGAAGLGTLALVAGGGLW